MVEGDGRIFRCRVKVGPGGEKIEDKEGDGQSRPEGGADFTGCRQVEQAKGKGQEDRQEDQLVNGDPGTAGPVKIGHPGIIEEGKDKEEEGGKGEASQVEGATQQALDAR